MCGMQEGSTWRGGDQAEGVGRSTVSERVDSEQSPRKHAQTSAVHVSEPLLSGLFRGEPDQHARPFPGPARPTSSFMFVFRFNAALSTAPRATEGRAFALRGPPGPPLGRRDALHLTALRWRRWKGHRFPNVSQVRFY